MQEILALSDSTILIERNDFLTMEGDIDRNLYYVAEGSLKIYFIDDNEKQIIRFGYAEDFIVLMDSFLSGNRSSLYVQAIKKTVLKVIHKELLDEFLSIPDNFKMWSTLLESLVLQQLEREMDLLTNSPKKRYQRVLKRSPKLFQEIPNKYIANYLRMSPETLSRLKKS